jgi:hypothetical protein
MDPRAGRINWIYTVVSLIPANGDATELPYFSLEEQIRPGAGSVIDRLMPGAALGASGRRQGT